MERETQQRVWAAGAYKGLSPPKLAKALGTSVDTLKRTVRGQREPRAFESEEGLLRKVADACDLPYEFFTADFERLHLIAPISPETTFAEGTEEEADELERAQASMDAVLDQLRTVVEQTIKKARAKGVGVGSESPLKKIATDLRDGRDSSQAPRAGGEPSTDAAEQRRRDE